MFSLVIIFLQHNAFIEARLTLLCSCVTYLFRYHEFWWPCICAMACTRCKGRFGASWCRHVQCVRLALWIWCLPTIIPDQCLVTRRQRSDQHSYHCSVSLCICLPFLIVLFMNAALYVCGLHAVHGPRNFSVQQTQVALAVPRGNVKQCVSLNVPWN